MRELAGLGNDVYIVSPTERRYGEKTHEIIEDNVKILKVKTLNIQKTNVVEKGVGTLLLESQFLKAIRKYWQDVKFDLILYSTPPITFNKVINSIKAGCGARSYLLLKDIFPQNAVDLGMFGKDSFFYKMFRKKEKKLYEISDKIGCMSPANVRYIVENNPEVDESKVDLFPNSIVPSDVETPSKEERNKLLRELGIPADKVLSVYGGNLGKPQGVDFLVEVLEENENRENSFILIVGSGTEYNKLDAWFNSHRPHNSKLIPSLPKEKYDAIVSVADIGLIFLDHNFTIPNFPSRLLNYLEFGIPVLVASDPVCDMGQIAEKEDFGLWCESNDVSRFYDKLNILEQAKEKREEMGRNGRRYLEKNYDVRNHLKKLLDVSESR